MTPSTETVGKNGKTLARYLMPAALVILAVMCLRTIATPDVWLHLANGRAIVQEGALRQDALSFTCAEKPWVNTAWLYDVLLYVVWGIGGAPLAILIHAVLAVGAFILLAPIARRWASDTSLALGLLLAAWILTPLLEVSPATATLVFPALFVMLLSSKIKPLPAVAALLAAQLLWTNLASSFFLGPLICLVFAAQSYFIQERKEKTLAQTLSLAQLLLLAAGCAVMTLANPWFLGLHSEVAGELAGTASSYSFSWGALLGNQCKPTLFRYLIIVAFAIGAGGIVMQKDKLPFAITALAILSAILTIWVNQFMLFFALLAFPFLSLSAQAILLGQARRTAGRPADPGIVVQAICAVLALVSLIYVATNTYYVRTGHPASFGLGVARHCFPSAQALDVLNSSDIPSPLINTIQDGGYLAWNRPEHKIFSDSRKNLYHDEFYQKMALGLNGTDWKSFFMTWRPNALLLNTAYWQAGRVAENMLLRGWSMVYLDGISALYVPRKKEYAALIDNKELQEKGVGILLAELEAYQSRVGGLVKPPLPAHLIGAASLMMANRKFEHAAKIYEAITRGAPNLLGAWFNLGLCHLELDQTDQALAALEKARSLMPKDALTWLWLGQAYQKAGREKEAADAFATCEKLNPELYKSYRQTADAKEQEKTQKNPKEAKP